ncbi:MAG: NUDIX hydrolase [Chitinophagaceae bacterium]|nr:MAG: NUDIX hydrolase [Chitinophagaceae bacterium]
MRDDHSIREFLLEGDRMYMPSLSVDCVIFGFHEGQLKVLLLKGKTMKDWSLPGGFIGKKEGVDDAAARVLKQRTGLDQIFLHQFRLFGEPDRSDAGVHRNRAKKNQITLKQDHWLLQRFLTVGYYALVEYSFVDARTDDLSDACEWHDVEALPPLMMDHEHIFRSALELLRQHLNYMPVGYNLLPDRFTMPELQKLYESILGKKLDRRNFQRRMISFGILKRLKEKRKGLPYRAPYEYSFDKKKYERALIDGLFGGW